MIQTFRHFLALISIFVYYNYLLEIPTDHVNYAIVSVIGLYQN